MKKFTSNIIITLIAIATIWSMSAKESFAVNARVKDIAYVQGVRGNQLYGYGLVVGLSGTGDSQQVINFTSKIMSNVFEKMGLIIENRRQNFISRNIAVVMVTADIPPFTKAGSRIDVLVSTVGDCKSLKGGVLLQTPLQGADNEVYAVSQGPLSISGAENLGGQGQSVVKGHTTVASIPSGAIVEREISFDLFDKSYINLVLSDPDFTTATRLVRAINSFFDGIASPISPAMVRLDIPEDYLTGKSIIEFISEVEDINISPDSVAKIIINERTGTIVVGKDVRISTVAVAHGNLTITITESSEVSQPSPFGGGESVTIPNTDISIDESRAQLKVMSEGTTVHDVARTLNILGVTPRDLIAIFQAIKRAGSLHGELVIM